MKSERRRQRDGGERTKTQERHLTAEIIGQDSRQCVVLAAAPMPVMVPTMPCAEIESAGAAREVGDDQRHHHAEHGGRQSVQHLHENNEMRVGHGRKKHGADRQRCETDEQQGPAAP